jgi:hypothetical protein
MRTDAMNRRMLVPLAAIAATLLIGSAAPAAAQGAEVADWVVDGPIDRASTSILLLVTERACNSGQTAEGRIRALVEPTDAAVIVTVAVVPRPGDHTCQSNPPTPFVLDLPEPLGARALLDGGVEPPAVVVPAVEPNGPVLTPADAAARVIASDPRFAGVRPLDPTLIGQSAWYEAYAVDAGYIVMITIGWGDCPAGCIEHHTWQYTVSVDGAISPAVEGGDPIPDDLVFPTGSGDAPVDLILVAGPVCPVETVPPDPDCAPRPVAGATFVVRDAAGAEVARVASDADGRVRLTLPTGTYVFEPQPAEGLMGTPEPIAASVLGPDGFAWTFAYDTGIR